ncbi:MAG TPA: hypothetical protein VFI34_10305, partial [Candidatus Limnocylindrales bacterium]|nr:hypothetical protein [Candidatus Limnocylindrales bacterium]
GLPDADPVVSTDCSPATAITASDALFGVSLPEGARLTRISALVPDVIRSPDWLFRFSADPTDGLAVVVAPNGGLPAREYELVLHVAMGQMTWSVSQRICVSG